MKIDIVVKSQSNFKIKIWIVVKLLSEFGWLGIWIVDDSILDPKSPKLSFFMFWGGGFVFFYRTFNDFVRISDNRLYTSSNVWISDVSTKLDRFIYKTV